MSDKERLEKEIREILASETRAIALSEKLFSPSGLFSELAPSEADRKILVRSQLFKEAQKRFRELQYKEAAAFSQAVEQNTSALQAGDCVVKIEKSRVS